MQVCTYFLQDYTMYMTIIELVRKRNILVVLMNSIIYKYPSYLKCMRDGVLLTSDRLLDVFIFPEHIWLLLVKHM